MVCGTLVHVGLQICRVQQDVYGLLLKVARMLHSDKHTLSHIFCHEIQNDLFYSLQHSDFEFVCVFISFVLVFVTLVANVFMAALQSTFVRIQMMYVNSE